MKIITKQYSIIKQKFCLPVVVLFSSKIDFRVVKSVYFACHYSAEDVERLKQQDIFEQLLQEMITEFPHMTRVLVTERDMFISGYLQKVMRTPVILPNHG